MKRLLPIILVTLVAGFALGLVLSAFIPKGQKSAQKAETAGLQTDMRYRRLGNGSVVYEENPDGPRYEDISPAAGGTDTGTGARYQYDPLTQTYRARRVDSRGNNRQDIISDPTNP